MEQGTSAGDYTPDRNPTDKIQSVKVGKSELLVLHWLSNSVTKLTNDNVTYVYHLYVMAYATPEP